MTTYIFIKELQNYLLNRRVLLTMGLVIVLFVLNASIHVYQYQDLRQNYENNVAKNYRELIYNAKQNLKTLPEMVIFPQKIYNRPSSLSFISVTTEGIIPDGVKMRMFEEPDFETFSQGNPLSNPFLSIDWTTLIIYGVSFFCLCFSYNAFSGEREDGTMKLMLSNSLSRSSIIFGKFFSTLIVFSIPILVGIILSCLIFEIAPTIHLELTDYFKIGWFLFSSILMVSLAIMLGFFVSLLTRSSYSSLIICLLCWTVMVVIIPNISWIISSQFSKIPTAKDIYSQEKQQINALKDCHMGWYGNKTNEQQIRERKDCIDRRTAIHNSLWSNYHNLQFEQTNQAIWLSKVSPFALFRFMNDKLSGNNFYEYTYFFRQVKNYQQTYLNYIANKDNFDPKSRHIIWNEGPWTLSLFMSNQQIVPEEVPQFTASSQLLGELVANTVVDIGILSFWIIGLFVLTFVNFMRYDVR